MPTPAVEVAVAAVESGCKVTADAAEIAVLEDFWGRL